MDRSLNLLRRDLVFARPLIHFVPDVVKLIFGKTSLGHKNILETFREGKCLASTTSFPDIGSLVGSSRYISTSLPSDSLLFVHLFTPGVVIFSCMGSVHTSILDTGTSVISLAKMVGLAILANLWGCIDKTPGFHGVAVLLPAIFAGFWFLCQKLEYYYLTPTF